MVTSALHEFRVLADLPEGTDVIEAEKLIAEAMHAYLAPLGNHAITLVNKKSGTNVLTHMQANGAAAI